MTVLFGIECPNELYGALCGILVFGVLQLAWRSTHVRNPRTITSGSIVLIERTRTAERWRARVRLFESRENSTETEELELEETAAALDDHTLLATLPPPSTTRTADQQRLLNAMDALDATLDTPPPPSSSSSTSADVQDGMTEGRTNPASAPAPVQPPQQHQQPAQSLEAVAAAAVAASAAANSVTTEGLRRRHHADSAAVDMQNCTNENSENSATDSAAAAAAAASRPTASSAEPAAHIPSSAANADDAATETAFTVKLKYLNDDMKIASGRPSEPIGDFTRRHFAAELADNKTVRLIFNGQVLRPDTKTLRACGMFADCVVHCLVRATPPAPVQTVAAAAAAAAAHSDGQARVQRRASPTVYTPDDGDDGGIDRNDGYVKMVYAAMTFVGLVIATAWYMRFQHAHLFTAFSTFGLTLLSALLAIVWWVLLRLEQRFERREAPAAATATTGTPATAVAGGGGGGGGVANQMIWN